MSLELWATAFLVLLASWILLSGLDDLFIDLVWLWSGGETLRRPSESELNTAPRRRIALLVPLWREAGVIGRMLDHNLSSIRYRNYEVFVGVYPNDGDTAREVFDAAQRHRRVHVVICPHAGPTSKADCLNWVYRRMTEYEADRGARFDLVTVHDAEDVVHPDSLRLIDWFAQDYAMVQMPVLPLPTPMREGTHGLYCDEFAEYQLKDIPVRVRLGGFLPSNGVGTGYRREALERLARDREGQVFDPDALTEDYEIGLRLHELGYRQAFVPVASDARGPVATREYFPRGFGAAVKQRTRWVTGIVLQGWERHGWSGGWRAAYWFWRDRKGLVGNLLAPAANVVLALGLANWVAGPFRWLESPFDGQVWLRGVCGATLALSATQLGVRAWCSSRIYGLRFAAGAPIRAFLGNAVNFLATVRAVRQFAAARLQRRRSLAWGKTEHCYPCPARAPLPIMAPIQVIGSGPFAEVGRLANPDAVPEGIMRFGGTDWTV